MFIRVAGPEISHLRRNLMAPRVGVGCEDIELTREGSKGFGADFDDIAVHQKISYAFFYWRKSISKGSKSPPTCTPKYSFFFVILQTNKDI